MVRGTQRCELRSFLTLLRVLALGRGVNFEFIPKSLGRCDDKLKGRSGRPGNAPRNSRLVWGAIPDKDGGVRPPAYLLWVGVI